MDVKLIKISLIRIHGGNKCFIYTCVTEVLRSLRNSISSGLLAISSKLRKKKKKQSNLLCSQDLEVNCSVETG